MTSLVPSIPILTGVYILILYMICLIISNVFMKRMTSMDLSASLTFVDIFTCNKLIEKSIWILFFLLFLSMPLQMLAITYIFKEVNS